MFLCDMTFRQEWNADSLYSFTVVENDAQTCILLYNLLTKNKKSVYLLMIMNHKHIATILCTQSLYTCSHSTNFGCLNAVDGRFRLPSLAWRPWLEVFLWFHLLPRVQVDTLTFSLTRSDTFPSFLTRPTLKPESFMIQT